MSLYPFPREPHAQSVPDLLRQLFAEFTELVQQHIELTKTEAKEEGKRLSKAALFGLIGLVLLQTGLVFLGNTLIILFLMGRINLLAATVATVIVFLVLTAIFLGFCYQQIRSAQALLKNDTQ
jgi:uncharacterized membrane protein YqjE